jgi:3-oxoacyl-[acyl-carrier protein] reductase
MDLGLQNKRALVLGASRGLGAAIARLLAAEGAIVIAAARTQPNAPLVNTPGAVIPRRLDVGDLASIDALCDALLPDGVDILVNNSGGPPPGTAVAAARADWIAQFEAMAANLFHLTSRLLPPMQARRWGRIITIGSSGVEQPLPNLALSNGIRTAVAGWSKTLATELAPQGITVNMVHPGRIRTDRTAQLDRVTAEKSGITIADAEAKSSAAIPMARYGTADEFATAVAYLASTGAAYITGSMIRVDGGAIRSI